MHFSGCLNGAKCQVLLDTGADRSFADAAFLRSNGFPLSPASASLTAVTATGQQVTLDKLARARLRLDKTYHSTVSLWPLENMLPGVQVILGMDWLRCHAAVLDTHSAL